VLVLLLVLLLVMVLLVAQLGSQQAHHKSGGELLLHTSCTLHTRCSLDIWYNMGCDHDGMGTAAVSIPGGEP